MTNKEIISQLENLRANSEDFAKEKNSSDIWKKDIEALNAAIDIISNTKSKWTSLTDTLPELNEEVVITAYFSLEELDKPYILIGKISDIWESNYLSNNTDLSPEVKCCDIIIHDPMYGESHRRVYFSAWKEVEEIKPYELSNINLTRDKETDDEKEM